MKDFDPLAWPNLGVALLAAGSSCRFGSHDKLAENMNGRALGEHAAAALPIEKFTDGWVITSRPRHRCEPYWCERLLEPALNARASEGMGTSVALAAKLARKAKCDALVIALADMPFVPQSHFLALIEGFRSGALVAASCAGDVNMPPAIFDAAYFVELEQSAGDAGARALIKEALPVDCPPEWLIDIDTQEDLQTYRQGQAADPKPSPKGD